MLQMSFVCFFTLSLQIYPYFLPNSSRPRVTYHVFFSRKSTLTFQGREASRPLFSQSALSPPLLQPCSHCWSLPVNHKPPESRAQGLDFLHLYLLGPEQGLVRERHDRCSVKVCQVMLAKGKPEKLLFENIQRKTSLSIESPLNIFWFKNDGRNTNIPSVNYTSYGPVSRPLLWALWNKIIPHYSYLINQCVYLFVRQEHIEYLRLNSMIWKGRLLLLMSASQNWA